jgi:hypothetical protein
MKDNIFKIIVKKIFDRLGYVVLKKSLPADILAEGDFVSILERCQPYTMVSSDRSFALYRAVQYVSSCEIKGDIVECGVWKGGQSMIAALTLLGMNDLGRKIWLYDTYAGMSQPTELDINILTGESATDKWQQENKEDYNKWCYAPLEEVKKNVLLANYPKENFMFVKGRVEDTIPNMLPDEIALLRLDTDWYESTCHELAHLFPRLVSGGVMIIDDYGSWAGSRKAVDEYLKEHKEKMLLTKVGTGAIGVKV